MQRFAAVAGLSKRRVLPVPALSPALSSHWVGLITPVPRSLARPLVESLRNTAVAGEHDIAAYVPDPPEGLIGYQRAVELALTKIQNLDVPTTWSSASTREAASEPLPSDPDWAGGSLYVDERDCEVNAGPQALWTIIEGIGGRRGWYSFRFGWSVRGWIDRLTGGPGLVRGRRDPDNLLPGDSLDWWRVEEVDEGRLLRLRAEMRCPGSPGWSCVLSAPVTAPAPRDSTSGHCSTPAGSPATPTGGRSGPSIASSSAACSATSTRRRADRRRAPCADRRAHAAVPRRGRGKVER